MIAQRQLEENIVQVQSNIALAAQKAGRKPEEITLVAVTKTVPLEVIQMAHEYGITNFGESYVQEALPKIASFQPRDVTWHAIGHLQTNKVKNVVGNFDYIHSIDSVELASKISQQAEKAGTCPSMFIEVNVAGEQSKYGIASEHVVDVASQIVSLPYIKVNGLMAIAPHVLNPQDARPIFQTLFRLRDTLRKQVPESAWHHLSMGMTNDYPIAIEEGATVVRIGRAIFGER